MPKFTVLIIEDEKNIQTFVGKILKKQDYRVLYADCGKEGTGYAEEWFNWRCCFGRWNSTGECLRSYYDSL